jgi:hypothetical protein
MATEPEDDWQHLASSHRQSEMADKLERIKKKGRRSNRIVGAAIMFVGAMSLLVTGIAVTQLSALDLSPREVKVLLYVGAGSLITVGTGFTIWKGRYR